MSAPNRSLPSIAAIQAQHQHRAPAAVSSPPAPPSAQQQQQQPLQVSSAGSLAGSAQQQPQAAPQAALPLQSSFSLTGSGAGSGLEQKKEQEDQIHHQRDSRSSSLSSSSQDRNPVHPNAKTTSTINTSNGSTTTKTNISSPICHNCKTQTTPLWRRDESGQVLCNACGLFLKLHGRPRPISLKTDVIKSRNRVKHNQNGKNNNNNSNNSNNNNNGSTTGSTISSAMGSANNSAVNVSNNQGTLSSGPNTPELRARERINSSGKFSPKQYKPSTGKNDKNSPSLQDNNKMGVTSIGSSTSLPGGESASQPGTQTIGVAGATATNANTGNTGNSSSQQPSLIPLLPRGQQATGNNSPYPYTSSWSSNLHPQTSASTVNSPYAMSATGAGGGSGYLKPHPHPSQVAHAHHLQGHASSHHHFAQPLHYPSSTPAQFAPNLTTITSPLLLASTTPKFNPSQSSERASLRGSTSSAGNTNKDREYAAAGTLENLAHEHDDRKIPGIKLEEDGHINNNNSYTMSRNRSGTGLMKVPYSPSSALNGINSPLMNAMGSSSNSSTKLPALVSAAAANQQQKGVSAPASVSSSAAAQESSSSAVAATSPSFGPQFSLSQQNHAQQHSSLSNSIPGISSLTNSAGDLGSQRYTNSSTPPPLTSLKPLMNHNSVGNPTLPSLTQSSGTSSTSPSLQQQQPPSLLNPIHQLPQIHYQQQNSQPLLAHLSQSQQAQAQAQQQQQPHRSSSPLTKINTDDVNILRTRISELELVNDLYKTRIMELEQAESSARQRELLLEQKLSDFARRQEKEFKENGDEAKSNGTISKKSDESIINEQGARQVHQLDGKDTVAIGGDKKRTKFGEEGNGQ